MPQAWSCQNKYRWELRPWLMSCASLKPIVFSQGGFFFCLYCTIFTVPSHQ